ncbi:MAG: hypothetical protein J4F46_05245, partial [Dehalococcoidia bacterium]|nr:hypothetical protein [Dehalococcoidia bacterium]
MPNDVTGSGRPATMHADVSSNGSNEKKDALPGLVNEVGSAESLESLQNINIGTQSIDSYRPIVGEEKIGELESLASGLKGARVLHVNSTAYGGGVAEILRSHIPLLRGLGYDAEWVVIRGDDPFINVTKGFHNALQGGQYNLRAKAKEIYLANNFRNAQALNSEDYDYIVVHDPQPAAIRTLCGTDKAKWVWRCHIDTSNPNPKVWNFLKPYVEAYDATVYTMDQYVSPDLPKEKVFLIPPAIDPLSPKNIPLSRELCERIITWVGIDINRPLITQVSRFDPWKDPLGLIEVYRIVRKHVPGLQLA